MPSDLPTFSIVIPTINRPRSLERCLEGLVEQTYPAARFEVVIVNDGGERLPDELCPGLRQKVAVHILQQPNHGPGVARNTGVRASQGEYLAFTDDDCLPGPDWLAGLQTTLQEQDSGAVGGRTLNGLVANPYAMASQLLIQYLYEYYHLKPGKKTQVPFFSSNNLGIARRTFLEIGGFNQHLRTAEDRDLCARLLEAGYPLRYAPDARVFHFHDLDLKSYLVQHFQYGRGNYDFHQLRLRRGRGGYQLEPLRFYTGMLRYPFSRMPTGPALWQSVLLVLSQFGNISGFFVRAASQAMKR